MAERKNQIRWVALVAVTLIAVYLCWLMLQPFIEVLLWAAVLVIVFHPIHKRIVRWTRRPGWSAVLSSLLVIVAILVPLSLVALAVVNELSGAVSSLQGNLDALLDPNSPMLGRFWQWLGRYVNVDQLRSQQYIFDRLRNMSGQIANRTLGFVGGLVGVIVEIFFVIFTMYYFFRDGDKIIGALHEALPLERAQADEIFARTSDVISASVYGVLVIAAIQGALGGLAFWVLGLPSPLVWGVVMLFLSMIPVAGSFVVWVPAAIFLAATGHWGKAALLTAWGALVIGSVDNFLRPKLVGEKTQLHELLIFFSVLGGLQVFGVLGLIIGPVVAAITLAAVDILRQADHPMRAQPSLTEQQAQVRNVPTAEA